MAVTQADVDSLNAAIATGARSVTLGDQTVIYNTGDSLIRMRDDLMKQLAAQNAQTSGILRSRQMYTVFGGRDYS